MVKEKTAQLVRYLLLSDVHMGNPRINPKCLHAKFRKHLYPRLKDIDILVIAGDFWDTLLHMSSESSLEAVIIIQELAEMAYAQDFMIRVVRGTYVHDRNQNQFFQTTEDGRIKVFDTIDIEYIERYQQHILYMPDDLPGDHMELALQKMKDLQLERVDVIVHHGYFDHLLPPGIPMLPQHTLTEKAVNKQFHPTVVMNGHVHKPGIYKNIISCGSFERFAHGEEEAKGFFLVTIDTKTRETKFEFIENTDATLCLTADLRDYDSVEDALVKFEPWFEEHMKLQNPLRPTVYLRLLTSTPLIAEVLEDWSKKHAKGLAITKPPVKKQTQVLPNTNQQLENLPQITKANIGVLLFEHVKNKHPNITTQRIQNILETVAGKEG